MEPASKKGKLDTDPSGGASGSAAQPATLLEQVEKLGHYPKRFRNPASEVERTECSLAKRISQQWTQLPKDSQQALLDWKRQVGLERKVRLDAQILM